MSFHPDITMLQAYACGDVDAVTGLMVATHLETCPECQKVVAKLEGAQAQTMFEPSSEPLAEIDLGNMLEQVMGSQIRSDVREVYDRRFVTVKNRRFILPQTLSRYADLVADWRSYGGKVYSAQIDFGEEARVNLMYISEGVQIPQHTHKGLEATLVLHGSFSDEDGEYQVGDFLLRDASVKHSPRTKADADCLCLTVLTEPMVFTQGVARIFNMFGRGMYP
ncbi:ChrR family anti-sigma-E factor [Vibrio navarrensis]|uniref:ChrR family anti-sigma-E factor n=1 Tax=Vibrio navarrensis TaxID=29495 RepID=UPI00186A40D1|nr:ChrR family anti-sigma-E factor [Vibrio navarrensis]MBE4582082.1 transcriptional regulator [Vibrio navarrensis]